MNAKNVFGVDLCITDPEERMDFILATIQPKNFS